MQTLAISDFTLDNFKFTEIVMWEGILTSNFDFEF